MDSDVNHSIQVGSLKWKSATEVLCNHNILLRLKKKISKLAIRPVLLHGMKCWALKSPHLQKISEADIRMLH